ncbi:Uma2 family endonuclease [Phormidesmis sp. 146-35]
MIATPQPQKMSIEEYLEWEPRQEIRYEYVDGEVLAMTGGTLPHNDIAINFLTLVRSQVRARGCRINMADVKVQVNASGLYYYPDLIVSCDPRDLTAHKLIQYPKLIVEILTPSTESKDRGDKFTAYRNLSTLQEYVLVDSEKVSVECYRRGEGRMWLYTPYTKGDILSLESIAWKGQTELLYEDVQFFSQ